MHPALDPWTAPTATGPLDATVPVPGSKSLTNRLLVLAALADGPGQLRGALRSRDADLMIAGLRGLGVRIEEGDGDDRDRLSVRPGTLRGGVGIDCGLAGTVMRFLPPVAALAHGPVSFDGDAGARARPMGPVLAALLDLGVAVRPGLAAAPGAASPEHGGAGSPDRLPFTVEGAGAVRGGTIAVDASASSQFISGLLLAAPGFDHGLTLRHVGASLPSQPHIDMTVATLRAAGVVVDDSVPQTWRVEPGPIAANDLRVEPDLTNAGAFLAAALVAGGTVRVPGWPRATTQPGAAFAELLTTMGGQTHLDEDTLCVRGSGVVHGIDIDLRDTGELAPTIAALAAVADSPSRLRGIAHLRGHETDRLAALATEITRLGGQARETDDGLAISPAPLHGGSFRTYHDHRMAMAGAIIGLRVPGVQIEDVATTAKTLPGFTGMWERMLDGAS